MLRFGSGTYNVRDSEVVRDVGRQAYRTIVCTVHFLDGTQEDFELDRHCRGQELLDRVFEHLELIEKDYFGLQFMDLIPEPDNLCWLDASKSIRKQMQCPPYVLYFRVKFYVSDPSKLHEEYTRYHFYLQLRKDILEGRLVCPESSAALLGSYAVQSEFGDFSEDEHGESYLDGFQFVPNQTTSLIKKVVELHKLHKCQTPADAEFNFLDHAKRLDMYGVDIYHGRDNVETVVGFNMVSTRASKCLWKSCIEHHTFFRLIAPPLPPPKGFFQLGSQYRYSGRTEYQTLEEMKRRARIERTFHRTGSKLSYARSTIGPSTRDTFFDSRLSSAMSRVAIGGPTAVSPTSSSKNRFRETRYGQYSDSAANFVRNYTCFMSRTNAVSRQPYASPRAMTGAGGSGQNPTSSFFGAVKCGVDCFGASSSTNASTSSNVATANYSSTKQQLLNYANYLTSTNTAAAPVPVGRRSSSSSVSIRTSPVKSTVTNSPFCSDGNGLVNGHHAQQQSTSNGNHHRETTFGSTVTSKILGSVDDERVTEQSFELPQNSVAPTASSNVGNNNSCNNVLSTNGSSAGGATFTGSSSSTNGAVYSLQSAQKAGTNWHTARSATGRPNGVVPSVNSNGYANGAVVHVVPGTSGMVSQRGSVASRSSVGSNGCSPQHRMVNGAASRNKRTSPVGGSAKTLTNGGHSPDDGGLVSIKMKPDEQGRFGFNVKGGADQNYPIIVSRVIPGSPADTCFPRLNEGDQVLMINNRDVSQYSHDEVVRFIRACRESSVGELLLTVRPNAYMGEDVDEPEFQYVPQTPHVAEYVPRSDLLHQSILLLRDALSSGAAVTQFEQLYRKKPGMTMNVCCTSENINKNRYRDISPYDATRVIVRDGSNGDYINASFVNMEMAATGIVNRYIAAQGPLPHTTPDFWQAVWEQLCPTIVMLTAAVERGRIKCHQYWPRLYETQEYGKLQVTCLREKETAIGSTREFGVVNKETKEERLVTQMQYVAWPDHGVPEDPKQFIDFVSQVRQSRAGMVEPMLVHCSAGIGRTGVLILMETAMCLIEANEPVYPLDVVRTMRDQRAMLIQTSVQYKFVCEAIVTVYNEGVVKPLAEYQNKR